MLLAGLIVGPVLGFFDPVRDIGPLMGPMISIAVAIILFEGGLTLNLHSLADAAKGVRRLVIVGAPVGWVASALVYYPIPFLVWGDMYLVLFIDSAIAMEKISHIVQTIPFEQRHAASDNVNVVGNGEVRKIVFYPISVF